MSEKRWVQELRYYPQPRYVVVTWCPERKRTTEMSEPFKTRKEAEAHL